VCGSVVHPYSGFDQTAYFHLQSGGGYALLHDFNTVSAGVIAARNKQLMQSRLAGLNDDSEAVMGETLSIMGWTWLHEVHLFSELVGRVGDVVPLVHHEVGVMGQEEGYFIDVPMGFVSNVSIDGTSDTWAVFRAQTMMGSAFEHGVLEQLQGNAAASTIKMLTLNNANGNQTFLADYDNWTTVKPQLQGYSAGQLARLEASINQTHTLVLPEHGDITLNAWRGNGYIDDWQNAAGTAGSMGMIISGGYYGGYGTVTGTVGVGAVISETTSVPPDRKEEVETPDDKDPVDMTTGAFHNGHVDLALGGSEPFGLRFVRVYNSGSNYSLGSLGYGWSHNYDLHLNRYSNGAVGLGTRGPQDAAALIAYAYTALDLLAGDRSVETWLTTALATKWAMDQLTDNAVTVHTGAMALEFIQLPDGSYTPPPTIHRDLIEKNGKFYLQGVYDGCYTFDGTSGNAEQWEDPNGYKLTFSYDAGVLKQVASSVGVTLTLDYNGDSLLTSVADHTGRVVSYTYTGGELATFTDVLGHPYTYTYDLEHRLTKITRPKGNTVVMNTYDGQGQVITQTDGVSNTVTFYFSGYRNVSENPDGSQMIFYLDEYGRLVGMQNATGHRSRQSYNDRGYVVSITDRLGAITTMTYDPPSGKIASMTDAEGRTISFSYTAYLRTFNGVPFTHYLITQVNYPDGTHEAFTYDGHGNPLTRTDQADEQWAFTYASSGQVQTIINPAGGVVTHTFNADGTLAASTDSDSGTITYDYDVYKQLIRITHPDSTIMQVAYNLNGQITSITDENNHTYSYIYDTNGNLTKISDPAGNETQYAYDLMDRMAQITDKLGQVSTFAYDPMGRMRSATTANALSTTFGYDRRGWLATLTLGGQTWRQNYDAEGIITAVTTPLSHTTSYETDKLGYTTAITDPLGQVTSLAWDAMGRLTAVTDPLARTVAYGYDARGQVMTATLPLIGTVHYVRDKLGLVKEIVDPNGSRWTFDRTSMGSIQAMTDPLSNTWSYTRTNRGQLGTTTYPDGHTLTRTYDAVGNLTGEHYSDGTVRQFTYNALDELLATNSLTLTRDAGGRVIATNSHGLVFGATYDGSRLKTVSYHGLFTVTYSYEITTGLLSRVADSLTGMWVDFTYDDDQRLIGITRSNSVTTTYTWDQAGRLLRLQDGHIIDIQQTLDAAGQVVQASMTVPLDPVAALATGEEHFDYDAASQVSTAGYSYDSSGRQTAAPGHTYKWNDAGRLTGVDTVTLGYNGMGDVITRTVGGTTVQYDYNYALGLTPIVSEKDASTRQFQAYYVWSPDGRLLYMIDPTAGNKIYFYHFDRAGSTLALSDAAGSVTDAYAYTPYGQLLAHEGENKQPFTFVGQWGVRQEGPTGELYHMRARYYDARTVRFLQRDPLWPTLADVQALNPYQYAAQNPLMFADPTGLLKLDPAKIAKMAQRMKKLARNTKKLGGNAASGTLGNSLTKGSGRELSSFEAALFGVAAQVPGSDEMLNLMNQDWSNFQAPSQGIPEYIGGGVTRDIVAAPFTLAKFLLNLGQDLSWIHSGNRESPDKYLGFWTELGYALAKEVAESKIIKGLIRGCEMVEEGWTKIGEWGVYGYRKTIEKAQEVGKQYGSDMGTLIYGDRKEQAELTNKIYRSNNPIDVVGRNIGEAAYAVYNYFWGSD